MKSPSWQRDARSADQITRYGNHPDHMAESWGQGEPVVVVIHGGFWRPQWDRAHARSLAAGLAEYGWQVNLPEYRRRDEAGRGVDPASGEVLALLDLAAWWDHESPQLIGRRVVLVGHSAGGHLAMLLAHRVTAGAVAGVVSLAGVLDLRAADRLRLGSGAVHDLLGGTRAEQPQVWDRSDPGRWPAPPSPLTLLHGALDDHVPPEAILPLARRWSLPLRLLGGVGHFDWLDPDSSAFRAVARAVASHAGSCGQGATQERPVP